MEDTTEAQTTQAETENTQAETQPNTVAEPTLDDVIDEVIHSVTEDNTEENNNNNQESSNRESDKPDEQAQSTSTNDSENALNDEGENIDNTIENSNDDAQEGKDEEDAIEETPKEKKSKKRKKDKKEKRDEDGKEKKKKKKKKSEKDEIIQNLSRSIFGDSDEEGEDDIVPEHVSSAEDDLEEKSKKKLKKLAKEAKKKRKSRERSGGDGEEGEGGSDANEGGGDSESEGEEKPKKELSDFDQILESLKSSKGRRRKSEKNEAELSHMIEQFKERMDEAASKDTEAFMNKQLPIYKLKMLPEVESQLSKRALQQMMLDNDILDAITHWISPMPDGSLPNLKIRTALLSVLTTFPPIDTDDLKESGIGKVVMLLWKHPSETAENKKHARLLIERWSRPIFGISAHYKDLKQDDEVRYREQPEPRKKRSLDLSSSGSHEFDLDATADRKSSGGGKNLTFHARIPQRLAMDYKIQPKSQIDPEALNKKVVDKRFQTLQKKMLLKKGGSGSIRAHNLSVEGRNMTTHIG